MSRSIWLAERLSLPPSTKAILFDMDGVLIDSITLDYDICNDLVHRFIDSDTHITRDLIRKGFALSPPDFWRWLLKEIAVPFSQSQFDALLSEYEDARRTSSYALNPGISDILKDAARRGLKMAVVSNNLAGDVATILDKAGILSRFGIIQGNDQENLRKKPSPDTYLNAAQRMTVGIDECAIIKNSIIGIEAGWRSGAYSIGVATGGETFEDLLASRKAHVCYSSFLTRKTDVRFGDVLVKSIITPNEFVSHMIEHIAWRLGVAIDLAWNNSDWVALGTELGREIARIGYRVDATAVIGMIDDGSAEVRLRVKTGGYVKFEAVGEVSLDHFLSLRCEQLGSGAPLKELIEGLVAGLGADLTVRICSLEDAHHTWEGVFRAIEIALNKVCRPTPDSAAHEDVRRSLPLPEAASLENVGQGAGSLRVLSLSTTACELARTTAESLVSAEVSISDSPSCVAEITVSSTINVSAFATLLATFAKTAGLRICLKFSATKISSSHVVLEDTALVIGTALFKIMEARMNYLGINGAGSSLSSYDEFKSSSVTAAVSLEGRKFFKMVPFDISYRDFRRNFILGHNAWETLRSEDIDDFLDALAGGMRASIMVHFRDCRASDSKSAWRNTIAAIGKAIREAVAVNPARRGLPPGVKATIV